MITLNPIKAYDLWRVKPYTMVSYSRLNQLYNLANKVKVQGDFVEIGCWNGGAAAVLSIVNRRRKRHARVWWFDTFEGFPEKNENDGEKMSRYNGWSIALLSIAYGLQQKLRLNPSKNPIVKGDIKDTIYTLQSDKSKIALLRIDVNLYESCKIALEQLYNKVENGGYIIFDDYNKFEGYRKAVDEFFGHPPTFVDDKSLPRNTFQKK